MSGLLIGLVVTLWIGFGRPKPPPPFKPVSVEGCPAENTTLITSRSLGEEAVLGNVTLTEMMVEVTNTTEGLSADEVVERQVIL